MKNKINYPLILAFLFIIGFYGLQTRLDMKEKGINEYKDLKLDKIALAGGDTILEKDQKLKANIGQFEKVFNENIHQRQAFVESHGLMNRLIGSNLVDDADPDRRVIRGASGALYYTIPEKMDFAQTGLSFKKFQAHLKEKGIGFAVIIPPNKINGANRDFPQSLKDYTIENTQAFAQALEDQGIKVLDLDRKFAQEKTPQESLEAFYQTDTHWKAPTILWAYKETLGLLEEEGIGVKHKETLDRAQYNEENHPKTYLGSMAKRTGDKYPQEKDDLSLLFPKEAGSYNYQKINLEGDLAHDARGTWREVFLFPKILNDKDPYAEKYVSLMSWGYYYERIKNYGLEEEDKVLIIRDSFALPLGAYLAQNVKDVVMVENRLARYPEQVYDIIDYEKPDYVLFMGTTTSAYYYPNMFKLDE